MSDSRKAGQRKHMRFRPDQVEVALIQFSEAEPEDFFFQAESAGLVLEEAYGGCGLVMLSHFDAIEPVEGMRCQVKVGKIGPLRAEIRWVKKLDDDVARIGIEYLDPV